MKSGVPWQVKVRPEARETAREAARRAGLSLEEWLDAVIIDSAANAGIGPVAAAGSQPSADEPTDWSRLSRSQPERYPDYDDLRGRPARDEHQHAAVPDDPYAPVAVDEHGRPTAERGIVGVHHRLDNLTRQIDQLARLNSANAERAATEQHFTPSELNELIARLDHRLDKLSDDGRSAANEIERRMSAVDRAVADLGRDRFRPAATADSPTSLDQALSEIADRQRALDDDDFPASARAQSQPESLPRARTQDLSGLERELRQINTQIEAISRPCGVEAVISKAVETLRDDLAEIGVMLQEAMPRKAVEALEGEVRRLADRIEHGRQNGTDGDAIAGVERGLAEVRDALQALTPAENLVGFDSAIKELGRKVELIGAGSQDPSALKELEGTIVAMRGIVSHVASNDALAKLSEEVRLLADKVDHAAGGGGSEVLSSLERRIASLADALEARNRHVQDVPHELESVLAGLADKIERGQLSRGDQMALGHLEDRIAKLVEKLDASDARLNHLETIERGLAELLIHLEHQRVSQPAGVVASAPVEIDALHRDVADLRQNERKTQDSLEAVHGTLGDVVDRLAMIETDMRGRSVLASAQLAVPAPTVAPLHPALSDESAAPTLNEPRTLRPAASVAEATEPATGSAKAAPAAASERRPIDPNLPPDHPLEPGSSATRGRHPSSPAERIAASEAALGPVKPPVIPDPAGKSNFIAAARRAAQAAGDTTARNAARPTQEPPRRNKTSIASLLRRHSRSLIVGASVAAIVLGSLHMAMTWFGTFEDHAPMPTTSSEQAAPAPAEPQTAPEPAPARQPPAATTPAKPPAGRRSSLDPGNDRAAVTAPVPDVQLAIETARQVMGGQVIAGQVIGGQGANAASLAPAPEREVTGTVSRPAAKPATGMPAPAAVLPAAPGPTAAAKALAAHAAPAPTSLAPATQAPLTGVPSINTDALPASIGHALRAAAAKGDPAACFEIAQRYTEGRGLPQDFAEAAVWFERATKQGLAPAHFRLGGLYEKGLGVKKDLDVARRHYVLAGEAGNGKALHNLAVLHAEGMDGKPDYPTAAKWFRKAAQYGVADSQYNLGVLYARGIGVEQNLSEAYKWFALAAREGDRESTKKRDDIAARLDERSLATANAAVEAWAPESQPETAVQVKTPPGGWDSAAAPTAPAAPAPVPTPAAQPAPKRKPVAAAPPKLDWSIPRLAQ